MTPKRREQCILLLDDCLDSAIVKERVEALGFAVERFADHFSDPSGQRQSNVKDNKVIRLCAERGYLLFTLDSEMKRTFIEDLKATDIGVIATARNNDGLEPWFEALKKARPVILREFKKHERPYFSILHRSGKVVTECLASRTTRRTRPGEKSRS